MKVVKLDCGNCGVSFSRAKKEYDRQIRNGKTRFFCGIKCTGIKVNEEKKTELELERMCVSCGNSFTIDYYKPSKIPPSHCSLSCASKNSVTDKRRKAAVESGKLNKRNLTSKTLAKGLRSRESWKYVQLKSALKKGKIPHEFESELGGFVFDLALFSRKVYVEFDGKDHDNVWQAERDKLKTRLAKNEGWDVIRVRVKENSVIPAKLLKEIIRNVKAVIA